MNIQNARGTALLTTLLVLSFSAMTIMALVNIQQLLMYRTEQTIHSLENFQYAMGVEDWAKGRLFTYINANNDEKSTFTFPQILPLTPIPYGTVYGELFDAEGGFNLNNLRDTKKTVENFVNGLTAVYPDISTGKATELFQVIQNQFTKNTGATPSLFITSTELRPSNILSPSQFDELNHWMTALPSQSQLSINTATPEALVMESFGKIDRETAQKMIETRNELGWISNLEQLQQNPIFKDENFNKIKFNLEPQNFWVITTVTEGKSIYTLHTLLKITKSQGKISIQTLWRSYGTQ